MLLYGTFSGYGLILMRFVTLCFINGILIDFKSPIILDGSGEAGGGPSKAKGGSSSKGDIAECVVCDVSEMKDGE